MLRTDSQNNFSFNDQIYVGDIMVMSLMANIDMNNPEELSYSPAIIDSKEYFKHLEEIRKAQSKFEDNVLKKQQELMESGLYKENEYEAEI